MWCKFGEPRNRRITLLPSLNLPTFPSSENLHQNRNSGLSAGGMHCWSLIPFTFIHKPSLQSYLLSSTCYGRWITIENQEILNEPSNYIMALLLSNKRWWLRNPHSGKNEGCFQVHREKFGVKESLTGWRTAVSHSERRARLENWAERRRDVREYIL